MNTEEQGPIEAENPDRYITAEELEMNGPPTSVTVQMPLVEMIRYKLFAITTNDRFANIREEVKQVSDTLRGISALNAMPREGGGLQFRFNVYPGHDAVAIEEALRSGWVHIVTCWLLNIPTGSPGVDAALRVVGDPQGGKWEPRAPGEPLPWSEDKGIVIAWEEDEKNGGPDSSDVWHTATINPDERGLIRVSQAYVTNAHGGINLFTAMESARVPDLPDIGLELNATETAVCHAAITMFHDTSYRGNGMISLVDSFAQQGIEHPDRLRSDSPARRATDGYPGIPFVRFTLAEMTRRAGMNPDRGGDRDKVKAAIVSLKDRRFYFSWERPKQTRGPDGVWRSVTNGERERITHEGPLFTMSTATDIRTLGDGGADIQLHATAVLLDQVNDTFGGSNYVMIPRTLVDDIRKARPTKGKRGGLVDHTYRFLVYLHEKVKKRGKKSGHTLRLDEAWQDIARIVKLPPSVIATQGPRAQAALLEIYSTAKALGYLSNFERITSGKAAYRRGIRDILTVDARAFQPKGSDTSADSSPKALPDGGISDPGTSPEKRGPGRGEKRPGKKARPRG